MLKFRRCCAKASGRTHASRLRQAVALPASCAHALVLRWSDHDAHKSPKPEQQRIRRPAHPKHRFPARSPTVSRWPATLSCGVRLLRCGGIRFRYLQHVRVRLLRGRSSHDRWALPSMRMLRRRGFGLCPTQRQQFGHVHLRRRPVVVIPLAKLFQWGFPSTFGVVVRIR